MRLLHLGQYAVLGAGALAIALGAASAAQTGGIGAIYGAREPVHCAARTAPAQGGPSTAEAAQHVKCTVEGIGDGRLYLLDDVKITSVGAGRPFNAQNDYFEGIDPKSQVYPITGSLVRWECEDPTMGQNYGGKNCTRFVEANAKGACYKGTTGDWNCAMSDLLQQTTRGLAPPK